MQQIAPIVLLLMFVAALVIVANKFRIPYPVLLVLGGLALSFVPILPVIRLDPELVFFFFLPPLLYPAALFTSWRDFRRNLRPILFLAIGLVLITMTVVAWVAHSFIAGLPWAAAFALGAIVSPPDAVAAEAILKRLRVPARIEAVLEGESLVNDATALVAYQFAVAAMVTGRFSLGEASWRFVFVGVGGVALGLLVGGCARWVQRQLNDPPVQITISLLTPFAAYLLAELAHVSGVLSTVTAGVYLGWHSTALPARTRLQAQAFWEMIAFLLNGFIFVVIGLQLPGILHALAHERFSRLAGYGLLISATVVLVRIAWVFPATYLPRFLSSRLRGSDPAPPWKHSVLIAWAGMRGVVSLAAAFALPLVLDNGRPFPGRSYILFLTFCVILTTLVLQGLTLPLLIRQLDIRDDGTTDKEERTARLKANEAAVDFVEKRALEEKVSEEVMARVRAEYCDRIEQLHACGKSAGNPGGEVATPAYQRLQQGALQVERQTIIALRDSQEINDEALRRIQRDLDLAEARLTGD
ncbi:MAG TPA: Na+/H+ antiporter [Chthoniobacterales bacterium]